MFSLVPTGVKNFIAQLEIRVRNTPRHSRPHNPFGWIWGREWTPRAFINQLKVPMRRKLSLSYLKELIK